MVGSPAAFRKQIITLLSSNSPCFSEFPAGSSRLADTSLDTDCLPDSQVTCASINSTIVHDMGFLKSH